MGARRLTGLLRATACAMALLAGPAFAQIPAGISALGGEFVVNQNFSYDQFTPAAAGNGRDTFVVVWTNQQTDGDPTPDVAAQGLLLFPGTSERVSGGDFQVNTYTTGRQGAQRNAEREAERKGVDVCMDEGSGEFLVTWFQNASPGGSVNDIAAAGFSVTGDLLGPEFVVNTYTTSEQIAPAVCCRPDGDALVVYEHNGVDDGIRIARISDRSVLAASDQAVSTAASVLSGTPNICCRPDGSAVAVWNEGNNISPSRDGDSSAVIGRLLNPDLTPNGAEFVVNSYTTGPQGGNTPAVACGPDGGFVVAWNNNGSGGDFRIQARRFEADGTPSAPQFVVTSEATAADDEAHSPDAAFSARGDLVVAWAGGEEPAGIGFNAADVLARVFDSAGSAVGNTFTVNQTESGGQPAFGSPSVSFAAGTRFQVVYDADYYGSEEILAREFVIDGCGDGFVDGTVGEECDDGNFQSGDGCTPSCTIEFPDPRPTFVGSEFEISSNAAYSGYFPSAASPGDGTFLVAWGSPAGEFDEFDVFTRTFDGETPFGPDQLANDTLQDGSQGGSFDDRVGPSAAALDGGGFVVAWSHLDFADPTPPEVRANVFNSSGTVVSGGFQLNEIEDGFETAPAVCAQTGGDFVAVWSSANETVTGTDEIVGRRFDSSGAALGDDFAVNTYTTRSQQLPRLCCFDDGDFVVTWSDDRNGSGGENVIARRFTSAGAALGDEFQVNLFTDGPQSGRDFVGAPVICQDSGEFVVVWSGRVPAIAPQFAIAGRRFASDGTAIGADFVVSRFRDDAYSRDYSPAISRALDGSDAFLVAWSRFPSEEGNIEVLGRAFDSAANPLDTQFQVNTYTTQNQDTSAVAATGPSSFRVVWQSYTYSGEHDGLFSQRIDLEPLCGNGDVDSGEACDDGANNGGGDGLCLADCSAVQSCGDGFTNGTEVCDGGLPIGGRPRAAGEGSCLADCSGFQICGDGVTNGGETCDDGDVVSSGEGDCVADCTGVQTCGDAATTGTEACDDGDQVDNGEGGCVADCSAVQQCGNESTEGTEACDSGFANGAGEGFCVADCSAVQTCGDGTTNGTEVCDDAGDNGNGDGFCLSDCSAVQTCGDGVTNGTEVCDDGDSNGTGDGFCLGDCSAVQDCGDGVANGTEECDDANADNTDACLDSCEENVCGDGVVCSAKSCIPLLEVCDDGDANGNGEGFCLEDCSKVQSCGDGSAEGTEVCDDGGSNGTGDGFCLEDCSKVQSCGDGTAEGTEFCDDGGLNGTGEGACVEDCTAVQTCGDGNVHGTEFCDDHFANGSGEGFCLGDCSAVQTCGDGEVEGTEACDDGASNGSGEGFCLGDCSAVQTCGDADVAGTEFCDDGDSNGTGDGFCLGDCSAVQTCGDGEVAGTESCDDANTAGGDCCSSLCGFEELDAPCTDDGNVCTSNACDGAGTCTAEPLSDVPCDDGMFCTANDSCAVGVCVGSGDPCESGGECADTCDEEIDTCNLPPGTSCTDDGNVCTDNLCDGFGACRAAPNNASCDDGDPCTASDICSAGVCSGEPFDCVDCQECDGAGGCTTPPETCLLDDTCFGCGQPITGVGAPLASDAVFILRTSARLEECDFCVCDMTADGRITGTDALASLRQAIGLDAPRNCPSP